MKANKRGISLIVLIITVVVMLIIAGAIILTLNKNNPTESARESKFKTDADALKSDLSLYISAQYTESKGAFLPDTLYATKTAMKQNWNTPADATIMNVIPSMTDRYINTFEIQKGALVYIASDDDEKAWAKELGIQSADALTTLP